MEGEEEYLRPVEESGLARTVLEEAGDDSDDEEGVHLYDDDDNLFDAGHNMDHKWPSMDQIVAESCVRKYHSPVLHH
jgi:hypothetical protein